MTVNKKREKEKKNVLSEEQWNELLGIILIFMGLFLLITLVTYNPAKDSQFIIGKAGKSIAYALKMALGWSRFLIPFILVYMGIYKFFRKAIRKFWLQLISFTITIFSLSTLFGTYFSVWESKEHFDKSGFIGYFLSEKFFEIFGVIGSYLVIILLIIISIIISTDIVFKTILMKIKDFWIKRKERAKERKELKAKKKEEKKIKERDRFRQRLEKKQKKFKEESEKEDPKIVISQTPKPDPGQGKKKIKSEQEKLSRVSDHPEPEAVKNSSDSKDEQSIIEELKDKELKHYSLPETGIYNLPSHDSDHALIDSLKKSGEQLLECLNDFGVSARIENIIKGPVISRFEIRLAPGIKVSRISNLSDDIAYAIGATRVRVIAPIPGKTAVGIEVPNPKPELVYFRDLITSSKYQNSLAQSILTVAMGKDIEGHIVIDKLNEMPHFLIAGTTGSGKSVFVNNLILSLLNNANPEQLQLVMIDPKRVEFSAYKRLPHLLMPVLNNPKKAADALKKITLIMESRLETLGHAGARDITIFNEKVARKQAEFNDQTPAEDRMLYQYMPYIVVVIDELADLMITSRNEVEESIMRISQLARAVGIHLIVATQRPSVDVITGVIKANLLARVACQVSSKVDSRTILDMNGAEKLMGKGDMLYIPPGKASPIRLQSAFIYDDEKKRVVDFWKKQGPPDFKDFELAKVEQQQNTFSVVDDFDDEYYDQAVQIVLQNEKPSASFLQRRLKVGYNRAARMIEVMEEEGLISELDDSNRREILITWEEYIKRRGGMK